MELYEYLTKMKSSVIALILFLGTLESVCSQEPGFINDSDGYTNIREEQNSKSDVVAKILNGERFLFYPTAENNWWKVEFTKGDKILNGFVHNSRIKPEYQIGPNAGLSNKKIFHEFSKTASSLRTSERNISSSDLSDYYFIETIDDQGRVIDIKFTYKGKIIRNRLCYLSPWIKYEYPSPQTVISYNLDYDGSKLSSIECDMWYKTTYTLDDSQTKILKTQIEYAIDTMKLIEKGWKKDVLERTLEGLRKAKQPQPIMIDGYEKSATKLNGKFPISDKFDLKHFSHTGLEYEELKNIINNSSD